MELKIKLPVAADLIDGYKLRVIQSHRRDWQCDPNRKTVYNMYYNNKYYKDLLFNVLRVLQFMKNTGQTSFASIAKSLNISDHKDTFETLNDFLLPADEYKEDVFLPVADFDVIYYDKAGIQYHIEIVW